MNAVSDILSDMDNLAPMPQIMYQLMTISEDPKASMSDIAGIIVYDPIITASLLKTCNSAYFALPRKVDSVQDAIVFLGLDKVIELVMIKSVGDHLKQAQIGYGLHEGALWSYSVATAVMARDLAVQKGASNKQLIFTAALLKDIGKLLLDRFVANAIERINRLIQEQKYSFREAEKEVIGLDHAELGGMISEKWNFSSTMTYIIKNHHMSEASALEHFETSIVYLAELAAMMVGMGNGSDGLAYRFYKRALEKLHVTENALQEIIALFYGSYGELKKMLAIA